MAGASSLVLAHDAALKCGHFFDGEFTRPAAGEAQEAVEAWVDGQAKRCAPVEFKFMLAQILNFGACDQHSGARIDSEVMHGRDASIRVRAVNFERICAGCFHLCNAQINRPVMAKPVSDQTRRTRNTCANFV